MSEAHEMKTLTLKEEVFESFRDQQAREEILKRLPLPEGAAVVGRFLRVAATDDQGRITAVDTAEAGGISSAQIAALEGMFKVCAYISEDISAQYSAFRTAFGLEESGEDSGGGDSGETEHTHSYTSVVTTAAACTTAGVKTFTCSCGESYTESIPATGHTYVDGVCTVCGEADPDHDAGAQYGIHQTNADAILILPYGPSDGVDKIVWTLDNSGDSGSIGVWLSVDGSNTNFLGNKIGTLVNGTYDKALSDVRSGKTTITCVPELDTALTGKYQVNHSGYDYSMTWYNIKFYSGDTLMMDISPKSATEMLDAVTGDVYTFTGDTSVLSLVEG